MAQTNINQASRQELKQVPGIDDKMADLIIRYRDENGPFRSEQDLNEIPEVGDATIRNIKQTMSISGNGRG